MMSILLLMGHLCRSLRWNSFGNVYKSTSLNHRRYLFDELCLTLAVFLTLICNTTCNRERWFCAITNLVKVFITLPSVICRSNVNMLIGKLIIVTCDGDLKLKETNWQFNQFEKLSYPNLFELELLQVLGYGSFWICTWVRNL